MDHFVRLFRIELCDERFAKVEDGFGDFSDWTLVHWRMHIQRSVYAKTLCSSKQENYTASVSLYDEFES